MDIGIYESWATCDYCEGESRMPAAVALRYRDPATGCMRCALTCQKHKFKARREIEVYLEYNKKKGPPEGGPITPFGTAKDFSRQ